MNADRAMMDGIGLLAGIGLLVVLALAERQRLYAPQESQPIPAPQQKMCKRQAANEDIAWQDGKWIVTDTHWERTETIPCWHIAAELSSEHK